MGEIALTGEIRPVSHLNQRIKESGRLGFNKAIVPESNARDIKESSVKVYPVRWLKEAMQILLKI